MNHTEKETNNMSPSTKQTTVSPGTNTSGPNAIIGAACRVPGATNPHALWKMLEEKRDVQRKMPTERYNVDGFYHPVNTNKGTVRAQLTGTQTESVISDMD